MQPQSKLILCCFQAWFLVGTISEGAQNDLRKLRNQSLISWGQKRNIQRFYNLL